VKTRLFEAFEEGLGQLVFDFFVKILGRSLWRLWRSMKEKLWE
jgi:hypothetical protein